VKGGGMPTSSDGTTLGKGLAASAAPAGAKRPWLERFGGVLLLAPGTLWMLLFLVVPMLMMVYVSFWTQKTFSIEPKLTLKSWIFFFSSPTYFEALVTTVETWAIVLFWSFVIGYPVALYIGLFIRNKAMQTIVLVLCVIPFWTSFLIRVLAWRPMLGKEGAVNLLLMKIGVIHSPIDVLLFTDVSVIIGMVQIYVVFMAGPVAFMLGRIDRSLIEAARDLGAGSWRIFRTIIFPLTLPGVVVGAIFVSVMVLGEFATSAALSGRKVNLLGNIIVTEVGSLKWAFAAVAGVVLTAVMAAIIAGLLRVINLREEL
jgi:putative spermidine/putrescine transport system permease protein